MKFRHIHHRLITFQFLLTVCCIFLIGSCGGDSGSSSDSSSGSGALSFKIAYHDATDNLQLKAATIDCAGQGVATVQAKVFDPGNALLASGGPWNCDAGQGSISAVQAGGGRTVVVWGKNADGKVVFSGQKSDIDVVAGRENSAGTIECFTFVPSLKAPADGAEVTAGYAFLQWQDVVGATEYLVVISEKSDISDPVIVDHTTTMNYMPSGLSNERTYYWQVVAIDSDGNTGTGLQIWSFSIKAEHVNTAPVAKVTSPSHGSTFTVNDEIVFNGKGSDNEDGDLNGTSLVWTLDVAGQIGTGETCFWSPLNTDGGTHKITLTATDSERAIGTDTIIFTVAIGRLPDTSQMQIENYEPVPGEDMTYTINPPSYTKLDLDGNDLSDGATKWVMIRDNVTGLIWEVKTDDNGIHDRDNRYAWEKGPDDQDAKDVQNDFIAVLNKEEFGSKSDWRLPTIKELAAIVHRGKYMPAVNINYFPNTIWSNTDKYTYAYWSSTSGAYDSLSAWNVYFSYGYIENDASKYHSYYVRAVTGKQLACDLVDNGDKTVTDIATGLMWQQFEITDDNENVLSMTWKEALKYCETLELAGYDDWRLPNINELHSIVDYKKRASEESSAIDTTFFPNAVADAYWSSTSYAYDTSRAWSVFFNSGLANANGHKLFPYYIRAVRGGQ